MSGRVLLLLLASILASDSTASNGDKSDLTFDGISAAALTKASMDEDSDSHDKSAYDAQLSVLKTMPLQYRWAFWKDSATDNSGRAGQSSDAFIQSLIRMPAFNNYSEFMNVWDDLINSDLPHFSSVYLFKETIKPVWEDAKNKNGGKIVIQFGKGYENDKGAIEAYAKVVIAMITSKLTEYDSEICGATLAFRPWGSVISIWNRNASKKKLVSALKCKLSNLLATPIKLFAYKPHRLSMTVNKKKSSAPSTNNKKKSQNQNQVNDAPQLSWRKNKNDLTDSKGHSKWFAGSAPTTIVEDKSKENEILTKITEETTVTVSPKEDLPSTTALPIDAKANANSEDSAEEEAEMGVKEFLDDCSSEESGLSLLSEEDASDNLKSDSLESSQGEVKESEEIDVQRIETVDNGNADRKKERRMRRKQNLKKRREMQRSTSVEYEEIEATTTEAIVEQDVQVVVVKRGWVSNAVKCTVPVLALGVVALTSYISWC